jgi:hypothetical protein
VPCRQPAEYRLVGKWLGHPLLTDPFFDQFYLMKFQGGKYDDIWLPHARLPGTQNAGCSLKAWREVQAKEEGLTLEPVNWNIWDTASS